jgi:uncharacterized repeat protein (TIGR01451 family)
MKKLCCFLLLLSPFALRAQTYTAGHLTLNVTTTGTYDTNYCQLGYNIMYNLVKDSSGIGDSVRFVDTTTGMSLGLHINTTGASPWTIDTMIFASTMSDYPRVTGFASVFMPYTVKVTSGLDTIPGMMFVGGVVVTTVCTYNTVTGNVYIDYNSDCIFDSGDVGISPPPIDMIENLTGTPPTRDYAGLSYGSTSGMYTLTVQQNHMLNYTVYIPPYYSFIFPNSTCSPGTYTFTTLPQTGTDFPLKCTSNIDVQCYALSQGYARVGRSFLMDPYVSNTGCDSASGELYLVLDPHVVYNAGMSTYPADSVHGDTLIWNYNYLTNLTGGAYWNSFMSEISLAPDSTVVMGDTLCFRVYTNILAGDVDTANNDYSFCIPVVYSFDPNYKEVSPIGTGTEGFIPAGTDTLTYTLHFQNTGTSYAENIMVVDTLDANINASSLKILGTSSTMTPTWLAPGVIEFAYNGIFLPDSTDDEAASHGSVRFSVALNAGLPVGTQIRNKGYIYFDTNPAVVTNSTLNTIESTTAVAPVAAASPVKVYPNPAVDKVYVENLGDGTVSILNVDGSVVIAEHINGTKAMIDVSKLPAGVYILKTTSAEKASTTKLIKQY